MVDFHRLSETFSTNVYHQDIPISKNHNNRRRTRTAEKDRDHEPKSIIVRTRSWEKSFLVTEKLKERQKDAIQFLDDITLQKKDLYDKELAFQQRFFEFNEQIILNAEKRNRLWTRKKHNIAYVKTRSQQIEILSKKVLELRQYKKKFKEEIIKHIIYEKFLGSILHEFQTKAKLNDVIARYQSLESKKRSLSSRYLERNENLKAMCRESCGRLLIYHEKIMDLRSHISQNMVRYEEAISRTTQLECLQRNMWDICSEKLEDMIKSFEGLRNLNDLMNLRKPFQEEHSVKSELNFFNEVSTTKDTMKHFHLLMKQVENRLKIKKEKVVNIINEGSNQ